LLVCRCLGSLRLALVTKIAYLWQAYSILVPVINFIRRFQQMQILI
jgi:hypothetical protein